jgi:hypothetical protein
MTTPTASRPAHPRRPAHDRLVRTNRVFARGLEGQSYPEFAAAEGLTVRRLRGVGQEAPDRREIGRRREYALMHRAVRVVERKVADGELRAVPLLVWVVDRFDRYRGWAS